MPTWFEMFLLVIAAASIFAALNLYMLARIASFLDAQMTAVSVSRMSSTP